MKKKILIVDDDKAILAMLNKVIQSNGFEADLCESGENALVMAKEHTYSCMLLDINMNGIDGFEVLKTLRAEGNFLPVIIISGRKEDYDTIYGLELGADDYLTKPLNPMTLGAKVKALIRRTEGESGIGTAMLISGPFSFNVTTLRFYKNGEEIQLTSKESALVKLFMDNPNRIFSKDMIYDMVWGDAFVDENAVMVYINRLRQKIEDNPSKPAYIQNVRGLGYRFVV